MALIGNALQFCLLIQLLRLKSYREFPAFLAYVGFSMVSAIAAVATSGHAHIYFYVYWISEVIYSVLAFFVLQEAVRSVFRNFRSLRWFKVSFPSMGILILLVALFRAAFFARRMIIRSSWQSFRWKLRSDSCNLAYFPCLLFWSGFFTCAGATCRRHRFRLWRQRGRVTGGLPAAFRIWNEI